MCTDIKRFIRFTLQAAIILIVIDYGAGKLLSYFFDRMKIGEKARANYFIKKDTSDVWIFGSSRALYHYHPGVIFDSSNISTYNAGRSNQTILYHLALLKTKVKQYTPKIVVLDLQTSEFEKNPRKYERLSAILPYYKYAREMKDVYDLANPQYKYFSWSNALPYNSSVFATLYRGATGGKDVDVKGFMENKGKLRVAVEPLKNCGELVEIDTTLIAVFDEFVQVCRTSKIQLIIAVSPLYQRYECEPLSFTALKYAVAQQGLTLHDYSKSISEPDKFADRTHLNIVGAKQYSQTIAALIKDEIKLKP